MEQRQQTQHVLIAEDDPVMVRLLEFMLLREGFKVSVCVEGNTVVERALKEKPDLLLVDYVLPGMTGDRVVAALNDEPTLSDTPVIVVTGQGRDSIRNQMFDLGVKEVFTKPFSPISLVSEIKKHLM